MVVDRKYDWGEQAREAAKQTTIHVKRLLAKAKNWGAKAPLAPLVPLPLVLNLMLKKEMTSKWFGHLVHNYTMAYYLNPSYAPGTNRPSLLSG